VKFLVRVSQKCFSDVVVGTGMVVERMLVGVIVLGITGISGIAVDGILMTDG
jgi:hypothetical protein